MARNIYGLDLGTYEIKVYDKKQDSTWKEKNVIAIVDGKEILAVGDEAYAMFERTPGNIEVVFPMKEGVISRFTDMQYLLQNLLKKERRFTRGSEYLIAVPTDVTEVEKRAFFDLVVHSTAKAKEVSIVERGVAQCIGMGIDVRKTKGMLIVDFGAATTELSVVGSGGMVLNKMLKIGGMTFDVAVQNMVRRNYDFLIGRQTAEALRKRFGVLGGNGKASMVVAGRNPVVLIQANSIGKLDVAGAIGKGVLSVIKDIGLKDPYVGQTDLVSGEIAEDLTYYFAVSEQTPSSVGLGVLMNKDNTVRQAGGFIIQLMPDASEETISALEKRLAKVSSVTAMLDSGKTPEDILQELLGDMELAVLDRMAASFKCGCSKERFARGIASIKKSDIQEMIDAGENIETCCQFCNSKYVFTPDELKEMM